MCTVATTETTLLPETSSPNRTQELAKLPMPIGLLIEHPMNRRLITAALSQLELVPQVLSVKDLTPPVLSQFELIVADEPQAIHIREMLDVARLPQENIRPAVLAVRSQHENDVPTERISIAGDTPLLLPMDPRALATQLSIVLYAHRTFVHRYQSALEELHLNRRIFQSVTSGISIASATEPDFPLTYANPAFEAMTGYSLEEILGRNCRFLQGEERDQPGLDAIRAAIREQREVTAILRNYRKDGTSFWNELSLSPIRNKDGAVTHFVGIQTDVTARVEFEAALRESEKLAAVGRLASVIAHEINNPLEAVMNLLYLAQNCVEFDEARNYLSIADRELQRVKLITAQSLRFYKQSTRPQATLCSDLLSSVLGLHQSRISTSHIQIEQRERAHAPIICLESEIRQVINNLVVNAMDALPSRGGRLRIRTREGSEPRSGLRGVWISIADNGIGIPLDVLANIYRPFYTTKGASGTGLGLWISSEIVQRHQGRLLVRTCTRPGTSGTVFCIFLPFQRMTQ